MKIKTFVVGLVLGIMAWNSAMAAAPDSQWMIAGRAFALAYAKGEVRHAQLWVASAGGVQMGCVNASDAEGNLDNLFKKLLAQKLNFSVADPAVDQISINLSLSDDNWQQLIAGGNSFTLVQAKDGSWGIPEQAMKIKLWLCYRIPIYVPNVRSARLILRDAQGNVVRADGLQVDYQNEVIWFPVQYAGARGQLIISTWSQDVGEEMSSVYELDNLKQLFPQDVAGSGFSFEFDGIVKIDDDSAVIDVRPESSNSYGTIPLIEETISQPVMINVTIITSENEAAEGVWVRDGSCAWSYYPMVHGSVHVSVFDSCLLQLVPKFKKFGVPQVYTNSSDGKG